MSDIGYMTDERRMMQESARDFVANEVLPVANELDPVEGEIPMDLRRKMAEQGYFGIRIPEEYGGLGLGTFEYCMIAEELARGWMSCASIIARSGSWMHMVNWPEAKRRELTERSVMGDYLHSGALSEPDAGGTPALPVRIARGAHRSLGPLLAPSRRSWKRPTGTSPGGCSRCPPRRARSR